MDYEQTTPEVPDTETGRGATVRAQGRGRTSMYDEIAQDVAVWLDEISTEIALGLAPARAPFSANITEEQKLAFYKTRLFNADGSPNQAGRAEEIARLGAEGFGNVYQAVVRAYPELKPPEPVSQADQILQQPIPPMPPGPPMPPMPPMLPPGGP